MITPLSHIDILPSEDPGEIEDDEEIHDVTNMSYRPWYFSRGEQYPKPAKVKVNGTTKKQIVKGDRITNQLMFVPSNYEDIKREGRLKTILLYNGLKVWKVKSGKDQSNYSFKLTKGFLVGRSLFKSGKCPVDTCQITGKLDRAKDADLIVFKDRYIKQLLAKHPRQLYMLYYLESPYYTKYIKFPNVFNWTSTYR